MQVAARYVSFSLSLSLSVVMSVFISLPPVVWKAQVVRRPGVHAAWRLGLLSAYGFSPSVCHSICSSVCPSVCLFLISFFICVFLYVSASLSMYIHEPLAVVFYVYVFVSVRLCTWLTEERAHFLCLCISDCLSLSISVCLSLSLHICLSMYVSLSLSANAVFALKDSGGGHGNGDCDMERSTIIIIIVR